MNGKAKQILGILLIAFLGISMQSCNLNLSIDFTKEKDTNELLRTKLEKHVDPQSTIFEIALLSTADFSMDADILTVTFLAPNASEPTKYNINVAGNQEPRETKVNMAGSQKKRYAIEKGIKLCDLDFSKITSNVNKAIEMLKEEGYEADAIDGYTIETDGNPDNTLHRFYAKCKAGSEYGTKNGRAAVITNYYEFEFRADANGDVTVKE